MNVTEINRLRSSTKRKKNLLSLGVASVTGAVEVAMHQFKLALDPVLQFSRE
jgi:hypothetical protein